VNFPDTISPWQYHFVKLKFFKCYFEFNSSIYFLSIFLAIQYIMGGLDVDCYLANTWLVNSKKIWYGKQKHLRYKKVVWPRKTVTKRSDMRVWPRLTMHLRWKGIKLIRSSSIYIINKSTWGIRYICKLNN